MPHHAALFERRDKVTECRVADPAAVNLPSSTKQRGEHVIAVRVLLPRSVRIELVLVLSYSKADTLLLSVFFFTCMFSVIVSVNARARARVSSRQGTVQNSSSSPSELELVLELTHAKA